MPALDIARLPACPPARFARLEAGLLASGWPRPLLLVAGFSSPALLLGRHQRAASTVDLGAARGRGLEPLRRAGGGRCAVVAEGSVGVFLYAPAGDLLSQPAFPPDRAMNRYVRGLLVALRALGVRGAAYFGRDFVSAESRRLAAVSQEGTSDGALAFEAVIAVARGLALPPGLSRAPAHSDARAEGPGAVTLAELSGAAPGFDAVAGALVQGWCAAHGREPAAADGLLPEAPLPPAEEDETGLVPGGPIEIPIGFAEALTGVAGGRLVTPRLRGDFVAPASLVAALEASLDGAPVEPIEVGRRIDAEFRQPGAVIHGVRSLRSLADAVLAAGRAAAARTGAA